MRMACKSSQYRNTFTFCAIFCLTFLISCNASKHRNSVHYYMNDQPYRYLVLSLNTNGKFSLVNSQEDLNLRRVLYGTWTNISDECKLLESIKVSDTSRLRDVVPPNKVLDIDCLLEGHCSIFPLSGLGKDTACLYKQGRILILNGFEFNSKRPK